MAALTANLAGFRVAFPEFASLADDRVQTYLDQAGEELDAKVWGGCYPRAYLNYAAHFLALAEVNRGSAVIGANGAVQVQQSGQIQTATAAGLSVTFAGSNRMRSATEEFFNQSQYGQAYCALRRQCLRRGRLSW